MVPYNPLGSEGQEPLAADEVVPGCSIRSSTVAWSFNQWWLNMKPTSYQPIFNCFFIVMKEYWSLNQVLPTLKTSRWSSNKISGAATSGTNDKISNDVFMASLWQSIGGCASKNGAQRFAQQTISFTNTAEFTLCRSFSIEQFLKWSLNGFHKNLNKFSHFYWGHLAWFFFVHEIIFLTSLNLTYSNKL